MSRGLKAPFKDYEGIKSKDKHKKKKKSMMDNENFKKLKPSTIIVYMYMKLWANGEKEFDYSKTLGSKVVSPMTYTNAIKELTEKGFIERVYFSNGGGHKPNRYIFSNKWIKNSPF